MQVNKDFSRYIWLSVNRARLELAESFILKNAEGLGTSFCGK